MRDASEQHATQRPDDVGEGISVGIQPIQQRRERVERRSKLLAAGWSVRETSDRRPDLIRSSPPERLVVQLAQLLDREVPDAADEHVQLARSLGRIPRRGETVTVGDFRLTAVEVNAERARRVRVERMANEPSSLVA